MTKRLHRPQITDQIDVREARPLVVARLVDLQQRIRNPYDIEPDEVAIANGPEHGGTLESRVQALHVRGGGERKHLRKIGRRRRRPGRAKRKGV